MCWKYTFRTCFLHRSRNLRGQKHQKLGKMLSFEGSTRKFPYKTAVFAYKAFRANPPNSFSPSWICDFSVRGRKKELVGNTWKYGSGKRPLWTKRTTVWRVLQRPRCPGASNTANLTIKAKMWCFKKVEPILNLDWPYLGLISILQKPDTEYPHKHAIKQLLR